MWNTFKYTVKALVQESSVLLWGLGFPLIMATLFQIAFSNIDGSYDFEPIPIAVVENENYTNNEVFTQSIEALASSGEGQLFKLHIAKNESEAQQLLADATIMGFYAINDKGNPELSLTPSKMLDLASIEQTILKSYLDNFVRTQTTLEAIAQKDPSVFVKPSFLESLSAPINYTNEVSITANKTSGVVRYFYALLGFATIMAANIGVIAMARTQANLSPLGARRAAGATKRITTLVATLLASWFLAFVFLTVTFCYMRYVLDVGFAREIACVGGLAVCSLMTTALGACVGSIPKIGDMAKGGILSGLACLFGLFAGLFGTPSQKLADDLTRTAPLLQMLNPAKQVTDLFYSLYYYDGYVHYLQTTFVLLAGALVLFAVTVVFVRRQRYASL
ncbi:MAG: ABC transporter permease [Coriobacteriia bacterium]|jgi:hypothetical protein|nr:ABC transporter permease [Coriobacteriia bacterium]MDR2714425.1 ABC transporter permease [Coriobacteriales bacterium]